MDNKRNKFLNKKRSRSNFSKDNNGKGNFKNFKKNDNNKENENSNEKENNFNKGDYKKKYDKKYILSKLNKNANIKSKFIKNKSQNKRSNGDSITHNNLNLTLTENLFKKAKTIYEEKVNFSIYLIFSLLFMILKAIYQKIKTCDGQRIY